MALKLTYTDPETGVSYRDSYHIVNMVTFDHLDKKVTIWISVFMNTTARAAFPAKKQIPFKNNRIFQVFLPDALYNTYYSFDILNTVDKNCVSQAYEFLKTCDPDDVADTSNCPFDYKNDSTTV